MEKTITAKDIKTGRYIKFALVVLIGLGAIFYFRSHEPIESKENLLKPTSIEYILQSNVNLDSQIDTVTRISSHVLKYFKWSNFSSCTLCI